MNPVDTDIARGPGPWEVTVHRLGRYTWHVSASRRGSLWTETSYAWSRRRALAKGRRMVQKLRRDKEWREARETEVVAVTQIRIDTKPLPRCEGSGQPTLGIFGSRICCVCGQPQPRSHVARGTYYRYEQTLIEAQHP